MAHPQDSVGAGTMDPPRRSFFYKLFTVLLGAILPVPALVAAFGSVITPVLPGFRRKQLPSGAEAVGDVPGFFRTVSADSLSTEPQLFQIIADRKDAWNTYPKSPIGSVYVQKTSDALLEFEKNWQPLTTLKSALEAESNETAVGKLVEAEFSLRRREKERDGHHWSEADTASLVAEYQKAFPDQAKVIDAVAAKAQWEAGVRVFNVACPHAGCAVDYRKGGSQQGSYFCPCHNSIFAVDGVRGRTSPSARNLDTLDYTIDDNGVVLVRFLNFKAGHAEKEPV